MLRRARCQFLDGGACALGPQAAPERRIDPQRQVEKKGATRKGCSRTSDRHWGTVAALAARRPRTTYQKSGLPGEGGVVGVGVEDAAACGRHRSGADNKGSRRSRAPRGHGGSTAKMWLVITIV